RGAEAGKLGLGLDRRVVPDPRTRALGTAARLVRSRHGVASVMSAEPVSVVLADDHQVVRSGLRVLLDSDGRFRGVGERGDVASTRQTGTAARPRVLVLDLNLGGESSLDAIPQLRADVPETQIVVLTMQENPAFAQAALRAGAVGYVLKDAADSELM